MIRTRRWFLGTAGALAAYAFSGCSYFDSKQREWIFRATKETAWWGGVNPGDKIQELWLSPGAQAEPVAVKIEPKDGDRIHAWWWPAENKDAPLMLYLHGSRWNLTGNAFRIARLQSMGFSVLAIDYRGFGRSSGDLPSEEHTYEDAHAAWAYLKTLEPDPKKRFLYGHSLGGAVAIDLASREYDMGGLIVESTFTSMLDMAGVTSTALRYLPISWILTQRYDSLDKIERVRVPILIVHGKADRFVPASMSERLFEAAHSPKKLVMIDEAGHSNCTSVGFDRYRSAMHELFGEQVAAY